MSKAVVPTPPQRVVVAEENEELLERVTLSEMIWDENTIMGNVSDKITGKPVEGVCIKVCDNDYKPIVYNFTDVDGNFTLQAPFTSAVRIIAAKKGYTTFSSEAIPSATLEKKALNLELIAAPNGGIVFFGNVRDVQQKPLGSIKVTLYRSNSLNPYDFTFTNNDGIYVFDNIEPGAYRLAFQSQFYTERSLTLEVGRDQPIVTLEVVYLRKKTLKGTIHGIITDRNGAPVKNALVILCNANLVPIQTTYTNEKGVYLFYRLEQGTYTVMAK
ncbi:MAG: carboxypeptidase-like regulatory domain-containing protein [Clostridia bacterium]|nr:carboxypeptidase-like regulatory domain-containing protein [Clostridia bacterium]